MRLGIADHFGWAVAVTASADHQVVDRRRIDLVEPGITAAPVHYDSKRLDVAATAALVAKVRASVVRATSAALDDIEAALPAPVLSLSIRSPSSHTIVAGASTSTTRRTSSVERPACWRSGPTRCCTVLGRPWARPGRRTIGWRWRRRSWAADPGAYSPDECTASRETVAVSVEQQGVTIRRVGFRAGTDADLRMLHAVEAPVEAERRPDREPQPLESYIAFARKLPSQFDDHTWVAQDADGTPVASAACWSNAAGDPRVMECDVFVRRDRRRQRLGSRLLQQICETTLEEGRTILVWPTFDAVPAGEALARRVGARVARVNRTSELRLAGVDWAMVEAWIESATGRGVGYTLDLVDGPYPEAMRGDGARFHHIMQTAPRDDLDVGDVAITQHDVEELDAALVEAGRQRWTILVRDRDGRCVGGTEVTFEPWEPATALQQNTGIDPEHRGLGLAKWCKAAMLQRLRRERPTVERVRTGNAFSNAPMLAINDAAGFEVISTLTEWQADAAGVRRSLTDR